MDPISPPVYATVGERVSFPGSGDTSLSSLPSSSRVNKAFSSVVELLAVDSNGVATYSGVPFSTSQGVCTSKIPFGSIS